MDERRGLDALLGASVATALVPAMALYQLRAGTPAAPAVLVASGGVLAVVVALLARTVEDLADRLVSLPVAALAVGAPLAYLPYMVFATEPETTAALYCVVGLLAVVPGAGLPVGGAVIRNRRLRADATERAVVTVGDEDESTDSRVVAITAVAGVALVVTVAVSALAGDEGLGIGVTTAVGGLSSWVFLLADDSTEVAVTDHGLRVDRSVTDWSDIQGYRVADDEIELVRPEWYQPTRGFDRSGLDEDEEAALLDALDGYLPRLDGERAVARP